MTESKFTAADVRREVEQAEPRIRSFIRETPLEPSPRLSRDGGRVFLKMENLQVTGSFKARGALSRILSLDEAERAAGIVTASTGNHAMAVAHAAALLGIDAKIWLPQQASPAKIQALRSRGANIHLEDVDAGEADIMARAEAERTGRVFVSGYNDPKVIGGQGTIALELLRQLDRLDAVLVPVGGGGLIAGIAGYLKQTHPGIQIVGCQPANSPILAESVKAGRLLEIPWKPTLSDATAGPLEPGAIPFPICTQCVDDWILVSEDEIASALRLVMAEHWVMIEGASALPVAAFIKSQERWAGKNVALILTGSRIPLERLAEILRAA
jgi:threonine dehydratase